MNRRPVFCFGLLHDTGRETDAVDREHGARAAAFATSLHDEGRLRRAEAPLRSLLTALRSDGRVSRDPTIGTWWDPDRLHLPRVGMEPAPALHSTDRARAPASLSEAERLRRDGAPGWHELVVRAGASV